MIRKTRIKRSSWIIILFLLTAMSAHGGKIRVRTGIEVLKEQNFRPLQGKRVGLITNPTGVDNTLRSTVDLLFEAPGVELVALFGPEHGVRGNMHAGDKVQDVRDEITGVPVYSLFGPTRKPTQEMLQGIDVLVYDIQDIGCRSFTYVSTMGLAMEAAAQAGIEFMVLDRPNPLGGYKVEGCITEADCKSFVSQFPIPYVYGLTCGELAMLLNGEHLLQDSMICNLSVIKMKGWKRGMAFAETGLQWVPPSPHIPQPCSAVGYPISGIMGEFSYMNIGVGYTLPFQMFAAPWVDAVKLTDAMNDLNLPGIIFRPIYAKPFYAAMQGEQVQGVQVHFTDYDRAPLTPIQFLVAQEVARLWPEHALFRVAEEKRLRMFDIVCGSLEIRKRFSERHKWEDVRPYWEKDADTFRQISKKYYLYKK
ncbi:MAG: DUF1343 domain-containing protein [Bacteroidaceae bacterium]|nr:DUF1343 domain-containing protein [Bacteroidaceae bacterium]